MPARHVPVRHALAGALFAGLLFEIVKHLFVAYVMRVPTYNMVYGTFASVPIFLFWLFCCWIVVLIGAETAATFSYFGHDHALSARRESDAQSLGEGAHILVQSGERRDHGPCLHAGYAHDVHQRAAPRRKRN